MTTLADVMRTKLLTVPPATSVAEAATMMGEWGVGSVLVMEDDELRGIFTERDILRALGQHYDAAGHPVADWMTADPVTIDAATDPREALQQMLDHGFRHLPVLEDGRVVGVVSMRDLSATANPS